MPLPKPSQDEERDAFISRCMGDEVMKKEYPEQGQRTAVCFTQWRENGEKGERGGDRAGPKERPIQNDNTDEVRETEAGTIRIRIKDPKEFIRYRIKDLGKGIKAVIGFYAEDKGSTVQAYIFDKEEWAVDRAKAWVERHKLHDSTDFAVPSLSEIYEMKRRIAILLVGTKRFSLNEIVRLTGLSRSTVYRLKKT